MAYLNLCKQYHPDLNTDNSDNSRNNRERFQEINEAYNCLIKDDERHSYDNGLRGQTSANSYDNNFYYNNDKNRNRHPFENFSKNYYEREAYRFYQEMGRRRQREEDYFKSRYSKRPNDPNSYYGFKGLRKQPNSTVVFILMTLTLIGAVLQYLHYVAAKMRIEQQRIESMRNARYYNRPKHQNRTLDDHILAIEKQILCKNTNNKDPSCVDLD